ncbi:SAM-dependent methyltransferase [Bacillus sp. 1P10SD]|uniref:class I SAM-dependent methyltransferase n=1 Tax=Bacillus sp. 1P10SD TaxID=3132265 RepID=UPI0039A77076
MISYLQQLISTEPKNLISYADYISTVLYHPEFGYYMKDKQKIGRDGDFITTSNISDIYGRLIAKWFSQVCERNVINPVFCEIGAGNGRFARAFLEEWNKSIQTPIEYFIVESSPYHRKLQRELLSEDFSITQVENLNELEAFEGMVFSNELFDALPVHVIEKVNGELFELMIGYQNEKLFEKRVPLTNKAIYSFLEDNQLYLNENQRLEVPLIMENMLKGISKTLLKGLVVTADYGYSNAEWMEPQRARGSLRGYYQHQMIDDVLLNPGEMDITTHIHFDALIRKGEDVNLKLLTKVRQDQFLLKAGILKDLENHYDPNPFSEVSKRNRAIRSLIMPSGISTYFQIVIQQKSLNLTENELFSE